MYSTGLQASEYKEATSVAAKAFMMQSGFQLKIDQVKKQKTEELNAIIVSNGLQKETYVLGAVLSAVKNKSLNIKQNDIHYFIYSNQIKVQFNF